MRVLLLAALVLLPLALVASTGSSGGQGPAPAPTPIDVDDMMGLYPQQTVLVATADHVSAVTLLNHFTRYQLATNGVAQVGADPTGQWLYLLDRDEAPGLYRLRAFAVSSGAQVGVQAGITGIVADGRVLAVALDGRILVMKADDQHAWVDAYEAFGLQPLGPVMSGPGCGDPVLASGGRVAIVCRSTGEIIVDDLRGNQAAVDGVLPRLVAAAVADDGTLLLATADHELASVPAGTSQLVRLPWPSDWSGTVLADGLAVAQGGALAVLAEGTDDGAWLRVFSTHDLAQRRSLRLAGPPQGGVVALWPFAYYTLDGAVRHVDLTSGLLETMTEVGPGAVPAAVVNR